VRGDPGIDLVDDVVTIEGTQNPDHLNQNILPKS